MPWASGTSLTRNPRLVKELETRAGGKELVLPTRSSLCGVPPRPSTWWRKAGGAANIGAHEHALLDYATHHMQGIPGVRPIGTAAHKASVLSFVLEGYKRGDRPPGAGGARPGSLRRMHRLAR